MFFKSKKIESSSLEELAQVAVLLHVSEFRLFELAYHNWFGQSAAESELEKAYMAYLAEQTVPFWLRYYVREATGIPMSVALPTASNDDVPELAYANLLLSTDLWLLMTSAFLLSLLLV